MSNEGKGASDARPWHAQARPDVATVRRLVHDQFPALRGEDVRYFAEGWDFTVFAVGSERVFRFPKRATTLPWLARELVVLDAIQGRVPAPLPSDRLLGEPAQGYPFPFVGYRRLGGVPLDTLAPDAVREGAARALGRVVGETLSVVHALPLASLPPAPSPRDEMAAWIRRALVVLDSIRDELPFGAVLAARTRLQRPPPAATQRVVTHGDLGPEHLLVDPASHALTGIIDWADTGPWDAAGDFVGLWVALGEPGLEAALEAYDQPREARFAERVRFHGTRWLLHQVRSAEEGWRPETRARWLRRLGDRLGERP